MGKPGLAIITAWHYCQPRSVVMLFVIPLFGGVLSLVCKLAQEPIYEALVGAHHQDPRRREILSASQ